MELIKYEDDSHYMRLVLRGEWSIYYLGESTSLKCKQGTKEQSESFPTKALPNQDQGGH